MKTDIVVEVGASLTSAAFYGRTATLTPNPSALDEQLGSCHAFAARAGMTIHKDNIYTDAGTSGRTTKGRLGLAALAEAAEQRPTPFQWVLMADTARLARRADLVFDFVHAMQVHGIGMSFVDLGFDSASPSFNLLGSIHAAMDAQYGARLFRLVGPERLRFSSSKSP